MDGKALCDVCGNLGVLYTCALCGRRACGDCVTVRGVCKECLSGRRMMSPKK